ncbi:peptidase dimerization domain-containing protein [Sporosarcina sp. G11-34]|nr:peptidase dimerization domain-containing protein [Sporosarcina sp. G11-34]
MYFHVYVKGRIAHAGLSHEGVNTIKNLVNLLT